MAPSAQLFARLRVDITLCSLSELQPLLAWAHVNCLAFLAVQAADLSLRAPNSGPYMPLA